MFALNAHIAGRVCGPSANGAHPKVPVGPCMIEAHEGVVSIIWVQGDEEASIVISIMEFEDYVQNRDIRILP
ncbi:hypothetical protein [Methylibium sp.]|uniref:hypothetical protein n=1 Tax=Methylibium sp. TaxID=2067992 RepID=UPI003D1043ED